MAEKQVSPFSSPSTPPSLFLYDVTSACTEGEHNALAEFGYNRDGKRGMVKSKGRQVLHDGLRYISALTDPQIRKLICAGTLQLGLFSERVAEVEADELRKNDGEAARVHHRLEDKQAMLLAGCSGSA
jgi:hypothetical protein